MTDATVTRGSPRSLESAPAPPSRVRGQARRYTVPLDHSWQLATSELLSRLAAVPSRAGMHRPQLRVDLAENVSRTYNALWRYAHARNSALVSYSWERLTLACGYADDAAGHHLGATVIGRYLELMAEAGLVRYGGVTDESGRWSHVEIELLAPPILEPSCGCSSVGYSYTADLSCEARRRRESRRQRDLRRERPYVRSGGRGRAVARHDLFWGSKVCDRGLLPPSGVEDPRDVRAHEAGPSPVGVVSDAPGPWSGLERAAAIERLRSETTGWGVPGLRAAGGAGADPVAVAIAGWELLTGGRHPRLSAKRRLQLQRSAATIDRVANFGAGQVGAGAGQLLDMLEVAAADGALDSIESLGLFVTELRHVAREWRRQAKGRPRPADTGQNRRRRQLEKERWTWY